MVPASGISAVVQTCFTGVFLESACDVDCVNVGNSLSNLYLLFSNKGVAKKKVYFTGSNFFRMLDQNYNVLIYASLVFLVGYILRIKIHLITTLTVNYNLIN